MTSLDTLTVPQRDLVVDSGIMEHLGWDAKGLPVVRFTDVPGSPPIAVNVNGAPLMPTEPVAWLDGRWAQAEPNPDEPDDDAMLKVRVCGAVHSDGVTCTLPVMYEPGCCSDIVYEHQIHEAWNDVGNGPFISHRWKEVLVIQDMPYNCYGPIVADEDGGDDE